MKSETGPPYTEGRERRKKGGHSRSAGVTSTGPSLQGCLGWHSWQLCIHHRVLAHVQALRTQRWAPSRWPDHTAPSQGYP